MNSKFNRIRQPRFADGRWYSTDSAQLENEVQDYLNDSPVKLEAGTLVGLVAPHAGYAFSGHVAGATFGTLKPEAFKTVILLGPDHRGAAPGRISTPDADAWRTPLGNVPIAAELLDTLREKIELVLLAADDEHSLEVELPFLQQSLGMFKLLPLLMGNQSLKACRQLSNALLAAISETAQSTLFVASSDLSHFFDDATARRLDDETLQFALNMDAAGLIEHVQSARRFGNPLACGAGPIATVMLAAQALGASRASLLKYATSADAPTINAGRSRVVGYAALAFSK